jgi:hypothetical protein
MSQIKITHSIFNICLGDGKYVKTYQGVKMMTSKCDTGCRCMINVNVQNKHSVSFTLQIQTALPLELM